MVAVKLDRLSKSVLEKIIELSKTDQKLDIYKLEEQFDQIGYEDVGKIIVFLGDQNLITYDHMANGLFRIKPTHSGTSWKEYIKIERNEFWRKSIWTPILVAASTTLIINGLQRLLPLIIEWAARTPWQRF